MSLRLLFLLTLLAFVVSCSSDPSDPDNGSSSGGDNGSSSSSGSGNGSSSDNGTNVAVINCTATSDNLDKTKDDLGLGNAIIVKYDNGNAPYIYNPDESEVTIEVTDENVVVTVDLTKVTYNLIVSGATSNGSLRVYGEYEMAIYLNGVSITNKNGSAINIQNGKKIKVNLVKETENFLADMDGYPTSLGEGNAKEDAKGAFFSEGQLLFSGSGYLGVKGKNAHAIVSDDHMTIESGCIAVTEAKRDGIHVNDRITINGGILNISSEGDAIQSELDTILITAGQITIKTTGIKSHGIATSYQGKSITINNNPKIDIDVLGNGSKGIKSTGFMDIQGGTINIKATGSRHIDNSQEDTTSNAAGIKSDTHLFIGGGDLTIKSPGEKAKGINVSKSIWMTGGKINIEADDDGIKVGENLSVSGTTGSVTSKSKKAIDCGGTCDKGSLTVKEPGGF